MIFLFILFFQTIVQSCFSGLFSLSRPQADLFPVFPLIEAAGRSFPDFPFIEAAGRSFPYLSIYRGRRPISFPVFPFIETVGRSLSYLSLYRGRRPIPFLSFSLSRPQTDPFPLSFSLSNYRTNRFFSD